MTTEIKEYWQPKIKEEYVGKKCLINCSDSIVIKKSEKTESENEKWELRMNNFYDIKTIVLSGEKSLTYDEKIISEKNRTFYVYHFNLEEYKEGFFQKITLEGIDFNYDNESDSFINKEEFSIDINLIRRSKLVDEIIDENENEDINIPLNISPKMMRIILKFLDYNIQEFHKIYEMVKPIRYNIFRMNINNYDDMLLGSIDKREEVRKWYADFVDSFTRFEKRDIIHASWYINLPELFNLFRLEYHMWFKSRTFEELVEIFDISKEAAEEALKKGQLEVDEILKDEKNEKN